MMEKLNNNNNNNNNNNIILYNQERVKGKEFISQKIGDLITKVTQLFRT